MHSLVIARTDYCNSLYVNLPKSSTEKLQRIMRSAARLIAQPKWNASVTEICKGSHWLPIPQRAQFKVLTLAYKAHHNDAPSYISAMLQPYEPQRTLRYAKSKYLAAKKPVLDMAHDHLVPLDQNCGTNCPMMYRTLSLFPCSNASLKRIYSEKLIVRLHSVYS